jgi:hypothetical protein
MRTDRQTDIHTDMKKLLVAVRNLTRAPKNLVMDAAALLKIQSVIS